ncbi:MAG TPA: response regulator [Candidatus Sulfotelmatobacter sp.]|nr:response regulator [Candidatus Sulfotelmatobacter sp.]
MSGKTSILFVDDEPGIRLTLPAILTGFGFEVTTAATVAEALSLIATRSFDVLISDLNIGQPGDGFTVVSAMRRTQPDTTTFILTGYPAFETALEAIRQQVDDYLVKPADIETMVDKIREKLTGPKQNNHRIQPRPLADILEECRQDIVRQWVSAAREDPQVGTAGLSDLELADYLPGLIEEIIHRCRGGQFSDEAWKAAAAHGRARYKQGCTIPAIIREARLLQDTVSHIMQENLLGTDVSSVIPKVVQIGETIQTFLEASIMEFVNTRHDGSELLAPNRGKTVLLLGADPELSQLRKYVLSNAGFLVFWAESRKEALQLLRENEFDALVISYSISDDIMVEMTGLFRQHNPNSPIVSVAKGRWQDLKIEFDSVVTGDEGPEALIEAVETVLNRKQLRRIK